MFEAMLPYTQIIVSILLVIAILLQQTDASLGGAFGGGDSIGGTYHTRRGAEKFLFYASIILAIILVALSLAPIMLSS